jgi:hypothetical protein
MFWLTPVFPTIFGKCGSSEISIHFFLTTNLPDYMWLYTRPAVYFRSRNTLLNNFMEEICTLKNDSRSINRRVFRFMGSKILSLCSQKHPPPPLDAIVKQEKLSHTLASCFLWNCFNNILPMMYILYFPMSDTRLDHRAVFLRNHLNYLWSRMCINCAPNYAVLFALQLIPFSLLMIWSSACWSKTPSWYFT